ncbi:MAG: hypothetical protein Q9192_003241, partial [Flavoplaca navasiana]
MSQSSSAALTRFIRRDQKRAITATVARKRKTTHTATVARALSVENDATLDPINGGRLWLMTATVSEFGTDEDASLSS